MIDLLKSKGAWIENENRRPNPGDIIFYDWDDNGKGDNLGSPEHVGIVEKLLGDSIVVIEGNHDGDDSDKKDGVERRVIPVNGRYIRGYGIPKYDAESSFSADCKLLADKGIINSPDYWSKGSGYSDSNTVLLIKKFADYVRRKG
jgi:hypothetical protein